IVTLNNERSIEKCLKHIISQDYPKELIEYLNVDGGSTDLTKQIFKKYGFRTIESPVKRNAEAQRAIGIKQAKNNLIVSIDADNYLPNNKWLLQMVKPFMDDPSIVHANTLHYMYKKTDSIYNRYCALFGVVDPIVYYLQ
ncbi:MAG: glycosyltransferase, partial [Actinobacteria bacterium]|nr:glycosyltransferase [Actinomycetota bacterium]